MTEEDYKPYLAGLTFSIVFGFSFLFSKEALEAVAPFHLLGFRFFVASVSISLLKIAGVIKTNFRAKSWVPLIFISIFQPVLYFTFEILGIDFTTSSQAGLMISLLPVAVAVLGAVFLNEIPGKKQRLFIALSVIGVAIVMVAQGELGAETHILGLFLLLGAVGSGGAYNIISRKISVDYSPAEITFFMCYCGAIFFNLIGFLRFEGNISSYTGHFFNLRVLVSALYLGGLSSVLAFFMMNYSLSRLPASQAAVFANLTTVVSVLAGVFIRGEPFFLLQGLGALLIILGVWGTNYYDLKSGNKKTATSVNEK